MAVDLFNNSSNDYVSPNFKPCAGTGDQDTLQFLDDGKVGIVNGSNILSFIDFSSISIDVAGYNKEIKVLQSGEVVYVNGLTKGLLNRQLGFLIPDLSSNSALDPYFMTLDFSINFYKNFKYYNIGLEASGNYTLNIPVDTAGDMAFSSNSINVNLNYDPCVFTFLGTVEGYDFDINNVILSLVDDSQDSNSPFYTVRDFQGNRVPRIYNLVDASVYDIPYARYPNGGMQGVLLKVIYPLASSMTLTEWDKWIYLNHIRNEVTVWETDASGNYQPIIKTVDAGLSGGSTATVMSAGDYLEYVTTNEYWDKIGYFYLKASAPDNPDNDVLSNLMNGFYLYNPQEYPVKVEYMVFV